MWRYAARESPQSPVLMEGRRSALSRHLHFQNTTALCRSLPCSLGGHDSTDYYGSAVPDSPLAICPPTQYWEVFQVPALLAQHIFVNLRCLSDILTPGEPGREAHPRG
jgi:hypothetical protein